MPLDGSEWTIYINETSKEIWLLSPEQSNNGNSTATNQVISYSIKHKVFSVRSPLLGSIDGPGPYDSVTVDYMIYFMNAQGRMGTYNIYTQEYIYKIPELIDTKVIESCLCADNKYVYTTGGARPNSKRYTDEFQVFDLSLHNWLNDTPHLNEARSAHSCIIHYGYIYVFGGGSDSLEKIFIGSNADFATTVSSKNWSLLTAKLSSATLGASTVICDNVDQELIYIIGGRNLNSSHYYDIIQVLNTTDDSINTLPFTLNQPRYAPAAICIDEYIYIYGGRWKGSDDNQTPNTMNTWEISNALYTTNTSDATDYPATNTTDSLTVNSSQRPSTTSNPLSTAISNPLSTATSNPLSTALPTKYPTADPITIIIYISFFIALCIIIISICKCLQTKKNAVDEEQIISKSQEQPHVISQHAVAAAIQSEHQNNKDILHNLESKRYTSGSVKNSVTGLADDEVMEYTVEGSYEKKDKNKGSEAITVDANLNDEMSRRLTNKLGEGHHDDIMAISIQNDESGDIDDMYIKDNLDEAKMQNANRDLVETKRLKKTQNKKQQKTKGDEYYDKHYDEIWKSEFNEK